METKAGLLRGSRPCPCILLPPLHVIRASCYPRIMLPLPPSCYHVVPPPPSCYACGWLSPLCSAQPPSVHSSSHYVLPSLPLSTPTPTLRLIIPSALSSCCSLSCSMATRACEAPLAPLRPSEYAEGNPSPSPNSISDSPSVTVNAFSHQENGISTAKTSL